MTPCRNPQPRATEMGRGAHIASGGEKSVGIQSARDRNESARDSDTTFPGSSTPIVTVPDREVHCPVLQLLALPLCSAWVLQRGLLATHSRDFWGALFLDKVLVETQTVIELCSFGKGAILPQLTHTASVLYLHLLNHLACPSTTSGPAPLEFSPAGIRLMYRTGTFRAHLPSPMEAFVQGANVWVLGCMSVCVCAEGGGASISHGSSTHTIP